MNKDQLEKLKDIINGELKEGRSLKSILKKYGVQKKSFNDIGYNYNAENKQFENIQKVAVDKNKDNEIQIDTQDVSLNKKIKKSSSQKVSQDVIQEIAIDSVSNSKVINLNVNRGEYLENNFDILMEIIENYKKSKESNSIVIELPGEEDKTFKTSVRINEMVWTMFKEFSKDHKEFSQKDLHSQALLEFMYKYK